MHPPRILQSKTILGFIGLLSLAVVLDWFGRLTPEMVDVIKWVGMAFFAVRGVANLPGGGINPGA